MLQLKKINSWSKVFISNLLCPYYCYLWDKCKDLQLRGIINQVFCLGAVITIKASKNGPPAKIYHKNDLKAYQVDGNSSDSPFLHKRSLCANFGSNMPCFVVEGISRTAAGSGMRSLWQILTTSSRLDFAVVLDIPLVCCICFFLIASIFDDFVRNFCPFFWEYLRELTLFCAALSFSSSK